MKLFIAGSGKLASAIINAPVFQNTQLIKWDSKDILLDERAVVVHAGSGRQLDECMKFCTETKSVLLELSTGLETEEMIPDFPLIICPNTSILLLKALKMVELSGRTFENYAISITESHQAAKKTEPGTAYAFARSFDLPLEQVKSIRDPEYQSSRIGIPNDFLEKHAYHKIVIQDGLDELTIETKVLGHQSYAIGVKKIIDAVKQVQLDNKRYTVLDLIDTGVL